ncbi:Major facilitator-type transporter hxnP [Fusarium oxysporum f. sp. albedinis]|nr:Major facilitator-type transporter hxnP [Fusarium oxysporum f. sp. albedinis]
MGLRIRAQISSQLGLTSSMILLIALLNSFSSDILEGCDNDEVICMNRGAEKQQGRVPSHTIWLRKRRSSHSPSH